MNSSWPCRQRWRERRGTEGKLALALIISLAFSLAPAQESSKVFRAGAATSNITPPLGESLNGGLQDRRATYIHDELHARCLVLDDGKSRLALVICDLCMIPREVCDAAKRGISSATRIPAEHVLISATHTHTAPTCTGVFQSNPEDDYRKFLTGRIVDGVRRAFQNLAPARIGWGSGTEPNHVFNRRWRMRAGTIPPNPLGGSDEVRMNPPVASPDLVVPAGPTDPEVYVLSVQGKDGRPIAILGNYSLHYVGGTGAGHVSADYYGQFADRVQQLLGADRLDPLFVGMLSNGTSGDVNNINFRESRDEQPPYARMRLVADAVASEAVRVAKAIQHLEWVPLDAVTASIELRVRKPTPDEVKQAREALAGVRESVLEKIEDIYARETVFLEKYPEKMDVLLQALRIGDLAIAGIPCEVFAEIGLEIKRQSPFERTFAISLANGYHGYLPTPEQHRLGGYETWRARSSYLEVDASPRIVAMVLELLVKLRNLREP